MKNIYPFFLRTTIFKKCFWFLENEFQISTLSKSANTFSVIFYSSGLQAQLREGASEVEDETLVAQVATVSRSWQVQECIRVELQACDVLFSQA